MEPQIHLVSPRSLPADGLLTLTAGGPVDAARRRVGIRDVLLFGVFVVTYAIAYRYAMSFSQATAAPFWFPDSVLLCALLRTRARWWWLALLATLPIRMLVAVPAEMPSWFLVSSFANDCAKAAVVALLLRRFLVNPLRFQSVRDFGLYCLAAVLLVPIASALVGAASRHALGFEYWLSAEQWFLGNALTSLIVTPFLFYWVLRPVDPRTVTEGRWVEALLFTCGLFVSTSLAFESDAGRLGFADTRFYAPLAFLVWAAVRFGMVGATGAVAALTFVSVAAAISGRGPFSGHTPSATAADLQQFLLLRAAPLYLVAVLIEQTERVGQSLRESEQRFRSMADSAPVLIWMADSAKRTEFFNQGWLDFTGRTLDQECGDGWKAGIHADDLARCLAAFQSAFDARHSFELEYRLRRHDGEYRWIIDRGVPRYAANGDFGGYIGTAIDVTDRHVQESALRQSEERYREVVESQTEFVCRFLPDTTLTFVNEAYCRFLARRRDDLLGTKLIALLPENTRELTSHGVALAASQRQASNWECDVTLADGSHRSQHWVCHAIFGPEGALEEFQAIGHDTTDRKHAEEADRKLAHSARLAAVGELTAIVAHEVNQPLCAILNNAEAAELMLRSEHPPLAEIREILADIRKDDLRADEVIRSILALVRKREMTLQPTDLNPMVIDALRLAAGDALRRRVRIQSELAEDLPLVCADRVHLEQVILNLLVNGMDAMADVPEAGRQLTVQTRRHDAGSIEVTVIDSGHGISKERMPQLFDSFFTTKSDGMGLGLSIARSIIHGHGGRIWAENGAGGGAVFHVTVTIAKS
ncbi:MAG TPA: PAS domain S-box protein [Steroidobacteraceae bacterium]|nr:PAS domain S-box protein [Steroidobacteraceae bacterium]